MPTSDFPADQFSSSNWEVYQDMLAPSLTRQRPRAWERAPVPAQAPRLHGHKIWKRAGTRSQTENGSRDEEAQVELEREGAGARKKLRIMGAKENIGSAPWMEGREDRENAALEGQLLKDLADLPARDLEPDALQFVPRKRTNVNHVITPRKPLRQTTLTCQGQKVSPIKSLRSPSGKSSRPRKSTRKSIMVLSEFGSSNIPSPQCVAEKQNESQYPVTEDLISTALGNPDLENEPTLLESAGEHPQANELEQTSGAAGSPEISTDIPEVLSGDNVSDPVEESGALGTKEQTTTDLPVLLLEEQVAAVIPEQAEESKPNEKEEPSIDITNTIIQSHDEDFSTLTASTTEETIPEFSANVTVNTAFQVDTAFSSPTAETNTPSPEKSRMVVFGETKIDAPLPRRRRILSDIIAAEHEPNITIKAPKSAKKSAEVSKAGDKSLPSRGRSSILRRSERNTRASAVNLEQGVTSIEQPKIAAQLSTESVEATTLRSENITDEAQSSSDPEQDIFTELGSNNSPTTDSSNAISGIGGTTEIELHSRDSVDAPEEVTTKPEDIFFDCKTSTSNVTIQPECSNNILDEDAQVPNIEVDKLTIRVSDNQEPVAPDTSKISATELPAHLMSQPGLMDSFPEPEQVDSPLSEISETSLLEFSPEITRTFQFDFSPVEQEDQKEPDNSAIEESKDTVEIIDRLKSIEEVGVVKEVEEEEVKDLEHVTGAILPVPDILESTEIASTIDPPVMSDDDTEMLLKFLTRVQANKAAKAEEPPVKRRSLPHSPLGLPLGDSATNLSSPPNEPLEEQEVVVKSSSPVKKRKRTEHALDDQAGPETKIRRSGRTRLPVKMAPPGAPNFIPMRRAGEGDTTVTLKRSEERDLATLTRVNTRKNKGGALSATAVLAKKAQEKEDPALRQRSLKEVFDERVKKGKTKAKTVVWAEELARFQDNEPKVEDDKKVAEEKKKDAVRVGMRSKIALGMAVNGTPAPKRKTKGRL
ncbi:hypothetical protein PVAG01_01640 [Phlyctema vagabunda]|uniref:Uncharacterized protein n=1 Tax=Phlyctema vagabunda TaxID=108571 RepID=A0ABR4PXQ9_9HELO